MAKCMYQVVRDDGLWPCGDVAREAFVNRVWEQGAENYRDLPWRNIDDAYAVLVSEVMLQQTQVSRVEKYWTRFLEAFPTIGDLARAPVAELLGLWQGLGYNRRALALKRTAEQVAASGDPDAAAIPQLPDTFDELLALPGIGPATAAGVMAFAYQKPAVYVETNVRAVFLHELFPDADKVPDGDLIPYVADTASTVDPRGWYYALLDYGAALKRGGGNPTRASAAYGRQSAFEGSRRQKRAELVRIVLAAPEGVSLDEARQGLNDFEAARHRDPISDELLRSLVDDLTQEGFLCMDRDRIRVAD